MFAALLLFSLLLAGSHTPAHAAESGKTVARPWKADRVLVVKSERRLYLIRDNKVFATYRVALGPQPRGHKVFAGDGRTPEGLYVLDHKHPASRFYRAIHVSYPSARDIAEARKYGERPGGLVMVHGQPVNGRNGHRDYRPWDWTAGCIAVSNAEMDEIWDATDEGTPIEILP